MLKTTLVIVALLASVFAGVVAFQPATYRVNRSATIAAPPQKAFSLVNDFHNWNSWSPWAHLDPNRKQTFEGSPSGAGAIYTWSGNRQAGSGRMTILESKPNEHVRIKLEFTEPFASTNSTEFTFRPEGNAVVVNWTMNGKNGFIEKAVSLFMNMEKMIGPDFEKGLAQMKTVAEKP